MDRTWLDDRQLFLTERAPLPLDVPFTAGEAESWGVSRQTLRTLVDRGVVRRLLQGVYAAAQLPDDVLTRARALALVVPEPAVVTDRTAAWLHGVDLLPRSALTVVPPVSVFNMTDTRVRRAGVDAGRRGLTTSDITTVHGVRVTTGLRTALDLGRLLWRFDALAALDGFLGLGVPPELVAAEIGRFRGYRGVRQLRALVPLADARAESPAESALRLHWYDAGLPRPELQHWVYDDRGVGLYRLDLALPDCLYGAEYDGERFHTGEADRAHDLVRREWCSRERGWHLEVFTKADVYDRHGDPADRLRAGLGIARRATRWAPYGQVG